MRRDEKGWFDEVVDVGRLLSQDRRKRSKTVVPPGQGDKGERRLMEQRLVDFNEVTKEEFGQGIFETV